MTTIALPDFLPRLQAAIDAGILRAGSWGDGNEAVCMMSAAVIGATSTEDCVTAGWPLWLADLNVSLFDANVGAEDEDKARTQFALDVATLVQTPRDMNRAHDLFVVSTLKRIVTDDESAKSAIATVLGLYDQRLSGFKVSREAWSAAYAAAADAAAVTYTTNAVARAVARAAAYAADYAADYDCAYVAVRAADYAADKAFRTSADDTSKDASKTAYAAARADLLAALNNS